MQVLFHKRFADAHEMVDAMREAMECAPPGTVMYVESDGLAGDGGAVELVKETLTDGSHVYDVRLLSASTVSAEG